MPPKIVWFQNADHIPSGDQTRQRKTHHVDDVDDVLIKWTTKRTWSSPKTIGIKLSIFCGETFNIYLYIYIQHIYTGDWSGFYHPLSGAETRNLDRFLQFLRQSWTCPGCGRHRIPRWDSSQYSCGYSPVNNVYIILYIYYIYICIKLNYTVNINMEAFGDASRTITGSLGPFGNRWFPNDGPSQKSRCQIERQRCLEFETYSWTVWMC